MWGAGADRRVALRRGKAQGGANSASSYFGLGESFGELSGFPFASTSFQPRISNKVAHSVKMKPSNSVGNVLICDERIARTDHKEKKNDATDVGRDSDLMKATKTRNTNDA